MKFGMAATSIRSEHGSSRSAPLAAKRQNPGCDRCAPGARPQTYLSGVEGGKRNPSIDVLGRVAAALAVDIEELFRRRAPKDGGSGASLKVRGVRKKVE